MTHTILHHPDGATLVSYAAASLPEPLAAVVAAHVSMCPRCSREVDDLERLGAALLHADTKAAGGAPLQMPAFADCDRETGRRAAPLPAGDALPAPIARAYGLTMASIPWRRLGPGVWQHRLMSNGANGGDLRLLRIGPGRAMPEHGHRGCELTLVIDGCYSDATGAYRRGDIQDVDDTIEHQPTVAKDGECICLIASERPARFKGLVGRLIQTWTGL